MTEYIGKYNAFITSQIKDLKSGLHEERNAPRPFVTISREAGAYGTTVAEALGGYLKEHERRKTCDWMVFDKELLKKVTEEHQLPETILPYLSEETISDIQDIMEETCGLHLSRYLLVPKINRTILHLAELGSVIIVGRGANVITAKIPGGIHVRLIASFDKRVAHIQEIHKLSSKQAREQVRKEDRNRASYVKKYLEKDIHDPLLYDLIINMDTISPLEAARMIGDLVLNRQ